MLGYGIDFSFEQHELLAEKMKLAKGKVMLSINDHPKIWEIFAGFNMQSTSIVYSIGADLQSKSKRSNELVIMNYWLLKSHICSYSLGAMRLMWFQLRMLDGCIIQIVLI